MKNDAKAKFSLGEVVATPGLLEALAESGLSPAPFLERHNRGDWGKLSEGDKRQNEQALVDGSRILSCYRLGNDTTIWVITEAEGDDGQRLDLLTVAGRVLNKSWTE